MKTNYETDVVAWANEQAAFVRAGRLDRMDLEHIAEEIEDVGKSEQRELSSRLAILLAHLLKWKYQPEKQCASWESTIRHQRKMLNRRIIKTPSLTKNLHDEEWLDDTWLDAVDSASKETGIFPEKFPEICPWSMNDVLTMDWLPA